jgi:type I restriction enzyme, S subunit
VTAPTEVALREVLRQKDDSVDVIADETYPIAGIYGFGRGLFAREQILGSQTSYTALNRLHAGAFVISRVKAWEGAVGVVPPELDSYFVSKEFPSFVADAGRLDLRWLKYFFDSEHGRRALAGCTKGIGARRERVKEAVFLDIALSLPPLSEQQAIVARLDALTTKCKEVEVHLDAAERDAEDLLRAYVFRPPGEQPRMRRVSEFLAQRQPDVAVDASARYRFAGVYSFGRGVFASVVKTGTDFAYARLSTVRAGDFIYPKLMAWEGALGVVPIDCDGMVVSPEFPVFTVDTDVVLPEVLDVYFRTPQVWPVLAELSGGTNVRRRRLQPTAFLKYEMPLPSMSAQVKVRELHKRVRALKAEQAGIRAASVSLLPALLERIFRA